MGSTSPKYSPDFVRTIAIRSSFHRFGVLCRFAFSVASCLIANPNSPERRSAPQTYNIIFLQYQVIALSILHSGRNTHDGANIRTHSTIRIYDCRRNKYVCCMSCDIYLRHPGKIRNALKPSDFCSLLGE